MSPFNGRDKFEDRAQTRDELWLHRAAGAELPALVESAYATGMVSQDTDIFNYELFCSVASFTRSDRHVIVSARLRASSPRWNLFLPSTHSF